MPVEYLYVAQKREAVYEQPELTPRQLQIFKKYNEIDYILYELSVEKHQRQVAAFGKHRMQEEVRKLQRFAENCLKYKNCFKSKFTTIRDSPNFMELMKSTKIEGDKIGIRLDKDYGKFKGAISEQLFVCLLRLVIKMSFDM